MKNAFAWLVSILVAVCQDNGGVFRTQVRLIEVYAVVFDSGSRYVDGLSQERFRIFDQETPVKPTVFQPGTSGLTCAILLDTTGSMAADLPAVKNSISRLIDELGPADEVGVFGFSGSLYTIQSFTGDKKAARNAVLRARAGGRTALFDAIAQVGRELEMKPGRKALIVFSDGKDNASVLQGRSAVQRAKRGGVPIYAVGQGEALKDRKLMDQLSELSESTGGKSYRIENRKQISEVFEDVSRDLNHLYLLAYPAPTAPDSTWRKIRIEVTGVKGAKIRARDGYFLD